ncbi:MAG: PQQ-binding-like beta-propeller repeat protein [Bacteroidales bacterium]|jgi:outer membrane protein assembly factor BamB
MSYLKNNILLPGFATLLFAGMLVWWIAGKHLPARLSERSPGTDGRPKIVSHPDSVVIGQFFDSLGKIDEIIPGEWPRFRGTDYDNISKDTTSLAESWDSAGPPVVWRVVLGEGYAGPVVKNGRVYLLDYNERRKADMLRCFSLKSGIELWRRWYNVELKRNHGYSRTVPAVTEKYLVTIGPRSHVMCVDPLSGKLLWTIDMEKEFGIPGRQKGRVTPDFYSGQCPLIDNNVAVMAPGAKALMIGVDCSSGRILWKTPNPDSVRMSHGSIMPMIILGKRMYIYNGIGGVCGVSAEDPDRGKLLWETTEWSPSVTAASPVQLGIDEIAVFGSYGAGGARIKINYDGNNFSAKVLEKHTTDAGLASDQQTPVITGNYIRTVMPENAGALKKQLVCYIKSDLLKPLWTSGKDRRFGRGLGPYIVSGNKLFLLDDDANLFLYKLEGSNATLVSEHRITNGTEAWGPMAIAGNYLLMRDSRNIVCLNIGKRE